MKRLIIALAAIGILAPTVSMVEAAPRGHHQQTKQYNSHKKSTVKKDVRRHNDRRNHWTRGKALPRQYRGNYVRNYKSYRLGQPPRGHRWVRVNNEFLLINSLSGIIASIVYAR